MRAIRNRWWPIVPITMALLLSTTAIGDSRILFSSDRDSAGDIYNMKDTGETPPNPSAVQVTDESPSEARNPTFTPAGRYFIYEVGGLLYMSDIVSPIATPVLLGGGEDPYAGPYINTDRDFRILYTIGQGGYKVVKMATLNVIDDPPVLSDIKLMTPQPPNFSSDKFHPAFCGDDHFVWVNDDSYATEICYQEFDADGPVGTADCRYSGTSDGKFDLHPSCDSNGLFITWARESAYGTGQHDIWIMDADDGGNAIQLTYSSFDELMPVWKPGGAEIAFAKKQDNQDYEIFRMTDLGENVGALTNNSDEDLAPSWGP